MLVDEEFGAEIARSARAAGFALAMPVERSGQDEFDLEFGEHFAEHIETFDPDFAKVLVRYNPDGDQQLNRRQEERLARLSDWLHANDRKFLVPATTAQLEQVAGDQNAYDRDLRPALVVRTLAQLQAAGVEPHIWKIEGLEAQEDRRSGPSLGTSGRPVRAARPRRGPRARRALAEDRRPGQGLYIGLAIGRTIWLDALSEHLAGRLRRDVASAQIAASYRQMIDTYAAAGPTLEPATRAVDEIR